MQAEDLEKKLGKSKRKTTSELQQIIGTRSDQNPNFCVFLGSGASRSSGIRTATEMVKSWREAVYKDLSADPENKTVEEMTHWLSENASEWYDQSREYASFIERIYPLQTNRRKFIETEVADKIPSIGYAYLVRIAEARLLRTIFTTNFDDLLNEAFYQFSSERAIVCAHDSSVRTISITSRRTKIIKLHGDYLFDDLKNTSKETQNLESNMKEKLAEFLKEYGLIIAGYSGSDKSITRNLEDMLDNSLYLQNGLFWCFRKEDTITPEALDILQRPNSFYVISLGFDELMADLYSMLSTDSTPFNSKLASDRATNVIDSYLQNEQLKGSSSRTIQKHLEALESDKNASLLSDMIRDLNTESIASAGLSDQNLLVYFEIERALKARNPEAALIRVGEELSKTANKRFKEILLHRRYVCSTRLHRLQEARQAVKEILTLEPANFYMSLNECSLLESRGERVAQLQQLKAMHPFSAPVLNRYAEELRRALESNDKLTSGGKIEDVFAALRRSLEVDPSLDNPAWITLFDLYAKQASKATKNRELLTDIVDKHLAQDAYSAKTTAVLFRYCRKFKVLEFREQPLFEYLQQAYSHHFPRDYPAHLRVFVEGCIEFNGHSLLRPLLEGAKEDEELREDPEFVNVMMNVYYDVFRDVPGAISYARDFLRTHKKTSVEVSLLSLYLQEKAFAKARELHTALKGAIDHVKWQMLDAKILENEGRYQDAIDIIESIPDRRDFDERYTSVLSYLELRMGSASRAVKRCRDFLHERAFPLRFEAEIINYEYGKTRSGKNIDRKRVANVAEATQSEMVKGVCYSLLEEDEKALTIFRTEAEKRFSQIDNCLRWPAISRHEEELNAIRDELLRAKRGLNDLK